MQESLWHALIKTLMAESQSRSKIELRLTDLVKIDQSIYMIFDYDLNYEK